MGAHEETFTYETKSRSEIVERFKDDCPDPAGCANAEGYCGCACQFGGRISRFLSETFDSEDAAAEAILDRHSKWDGSAIAAYFDDGDREGVVVGGWVAE